MWQHPSKNVNRQKLEQVDEHVVKTEKAFRRVNFGDANPQYFAKIVIVLHIQISSELRSESNLEEEWFALFVYFSFLFLK